MTQEEKIECFRKVYVALLVLGKTHPEVARSGIASWRLLLTDVVGSGMINIAPHQRKSMVSFKENSGDSPENAIKIMDAKDSIEGIHAEYKYITDRYGPWKLKRQALHHADKDGRRIEQMDIVLADGTEKSIYFDITDFYGKFCGNLATIEDKVAYECKIKIPFRDLIEKRDKSFETTAGEAGKLFEKARSYHAEGNDYYSRYTGWLAILAALIACNEKTLENAAEFYLNTFNQDDDPHLKTIEEIMEKKEDIMDTIKKL